MTVFRTFLIIGAYLTGLPLMIHCMQTIYEDSGQGKEKIIELYRALGEGEDTNAAKWWCQDNKALLNTRCIFIECGMDRYTGLLYPIEYVISFRPGVKGTCLQQFFESGVPVNGYDDYNPLRHMILNKCPIENIRLLLDLGADPNASLTPYIHYNRNGDAQNDQRTSSHYYPGDCCGKPLNTTEYLGEIKQKKTKNAQYYDRVQQLILNHKVNPAARKGAGQQPKPPTGSSFFTVAHLPSIMSLSVISAICGILLYKWWNSAKQEETESEDINAPEQGPQDTK